MEGSEETYQHFKHIFDTHTHSSHYLLGEMHMYIQAELGCLYVCASTYLLPLTLVRLHRLTMHNMHTHTHSLGWLSQKALLNITLGCLPWPMCIWAYLDPLKT